MTISSPLELLLPYQRRWVDDQSRFKIGLWARQTGKSFSSACEAVRDCLLRPGQHWLVVSASLRQSMEFIEKAKQWSEAFHLAIAAIDHELISPEITRTEIRFANGSRITALPANPSTVRGYSANVILDEFAHHGDQQAIWAAVYPSITNPLRGELKLRITSTPSGHDMFADLWERGSNWSRHRVTIEDAKAQGLPVDVDALRAACLSDEMWAQEYLCAFIDAAALLSHDMITAAESPEASEALDPAVLTAYRELYLGVDFGRLRDPTVAWLLERQGDVLTTREVLLLDAMDTLAQYQIIRRRAAAARRIAVDYTGPGIGLADLLVREFGRFAPDQHEFGRIVLCTFTRPFKRQLFPILRRHFEPPVRVRIPRSPAIHDDLASMRAIFAHGDYDYDAPRTAQGHSDRCVALALAIWASTSGSTGPVDARAIPMTRIGTHLVIRREEVLV